MGGASTDAAGGLTGVVVVRFARAFARLAPAFARLARAPGILLLATTAACGAPNPVLLTPLSSGTPALLQAVSAPGSGVVWLSGHEGTWVRSTDGGATWYAGTMDGAEDLQFRDVEAFDAATAYLMSAGSGGLSRIYRTDDGGDTWRLQFRATEPDAFLDCMAFWDRDRGLAYGDAVDDAPYILRTDDGGDHWARVPAAALPHALEGEGGFAASGTCLTAAPGGRAWVATGNASPARVLRTDDWGRSWTVAEVPVVAGPAAGLTTVRVAGGGWGVALGGVIGNDTTVQANAAVSTDDGRSWAPAAPPVFPGPVYGAALLGTDAPPGPASPVVVAVGPRGLAYSADGLSTWVLVDSAAYWAVEFPPAARTGWAVGPAGRLVRLTVNAGGR